MGKYFIALKRHDLKRFIILQIRILQRNTKEGYSENRLIQIPLHWIAIKGCRFYLLFYLSLCMNMNQTCALKTAQNFIHDNRFNYILKNKNQYFELVVIIALYFIPIIVRYVVFQLFDIPWVDNMNICNDIKRMICWTI